VTADRARSLRRGSTEAETQLWRFIRNRQLSGWKFRRQVPIDRFVVDFLCREAKLIIELDGSQHAEKTDGDLARTDLLERYGYRVIRYWNSDVLSRTEDVLEDILAHLELRK